jgi:tRNA-modifying protein YgfZ
MSTAHFALLPSRGIVSVTGDDARGFLDNLVTNDMDLLDGLDAIHAGLLSPQGKILFSFMIVKRPDGFLLETTREAAPDLVKRLTLYRLRAKITLADLSTGHAVGVAWAGDPPDAPYVVAFRDPRHPDLGWRMLMAAELAGGRLAALDEGEPAWQRHRIALGVPEAGLDYKPGDAFPHEAGFDRYAGVSFTKGCFVGQEVVARMQHKTVVRKRVVRIAGTGPIPEGAEIKVGEAVIGTVGSVAGSEGLAMLRLDRALEARDKGQPLAVGDSAVTVEAEALTRYATQAAARTRAP